VAGTCECGNEFSGSIECGEFLVWPWSLLHGVSKYNRTFIFLVGEQSV
jgi:hypothetical protein